MTDLNKIIDELSALTVLEAAELAKQLEEKLEQTKKYIGTKQSDYEYKHRDCKKEIDNILPEYKNVKYEVINGVKVNRVNIVPRGKTRLSIVRNYLSFWRNSKRWVRKTKEQFDIVFSMSLSPVTILAAGNLYKKKHRSNWKRNIDIFYSTMTGEYNERELGIKYNITHQRANAIKKDVQKFFSEYLQNHRYTLPE